MAVLNLRKVPEDLVHDLKVEAAQASMRFGEYCIAILDQREHFSLVKAREWNGRRKKIAEVGGGVEAQDAGESPKDALPPLGKAQDTLNYCQCTPQPREWFMTNPPACGLCRKPKNPRGETAAWARWDKALSSGEVLDPSLLAQIKEAAAVDFLLARKAHLAGVELDREILVRWGLVENK